jgi:hypothetical protein
MFFFEQKNKKTFVRLASRELASKESRSNRLMALPRLVGQISRCPTDKSLFASFSSEKEALAYSIDRPVSPCP